MTKRAVALFATMLVLFVGVLGKIYGASSKQFAKVQQAQATRTVTLAVARGTLYDRTGQRLTNASRQWKACAVAEPATMAMLQRYLTQEQWQAAQSRWEQGYPAVLDIAQPLPSAAGLVQFSVPIRYEYPIAAQHMLGYIGADGKGETGIEQALDEVLREAGGVLQLRYRVDGAGRVLAGVSPEVTNTLGNADAGVMLTLDAALQRRLEQLCLPMLPKGAVVVTEPETGDILAAVSCPSYRADELASLLNAPDAPLVNRLLRNYNVGSVFKVVSVAAALEAGAQVGQTFVCNGSVPVGSRVIRCHHRLGHGMLDMQGGFLHSCNPYFIQLMQTVEPHKFAYMAHALGFGAAVLLADGLKTARAVLPSDEQWQLPSVTADLSFGQGSLLATPLHIAQLMSAVVCDGQMIRPRLVRGAVDAQGEATLYASAAPQPVFSADTARTLRQMMIATVQGGTGQSGMPSLGGAGGKTGTAQTGWQGDNGEPMVQSWFAGFYPAENPQFAVVVLSEDAGSTGQSAAPVFAAVCDELAKLGAAAATQ